MRELFGWLSAAALLLASFGTVHFRRSLNERGLEIGRLENRLREMRKEDDNLEIALAEAASPEALEARAKALGLTGGTR